MGGFLSSSLTRLLLSCSPPLQAPRPTPCIADLLTPALSYPPLPRACAPLSSLEWVIGDTSQMYSPKGIAADSLSVMAARRMHNRLPSISGEFRQSVPLTRIRDIAHRGDIPKELKDEIKHTLQNKLHRSAGEGVGDVRRCVGRCGEVGWFTQAV